MTVVCAYDSPRSFRKRGSLYLQETRDSLQEARDSLQEEATEIVAEAVNDLREAGIDADGVAFQGRVRRRDLGPAADSGADIIIVGRGGRDGVHD